MSGLSVSIAYKKTKGNKVSCGEDGGVSGGDSGRSPCSRPPLIHSPPLPPDMEFGKSDSNSVSPWDSRSSALKDQLVRSISSFFNSYVLNTSDDTACKLSASDTDDKGNNKINLLADELIKILIKPIFT